MKIENTEQVDMELSKSIDELIELHLPNLKKGGKADEDKKEDEMKSKGKAEDEKKEDEAKSKGKADANGGEDEIKSKGKAEDDKKEEDEAKSKGKTDDSDEDDLYNKKSLVLTQKGLDLLKKAQADSAKAEEKIEKSVSDKEDVTFKKSVVQALSDLQNQLNTLAKRPAGFRKSVTSELEAIQKSSEKAGEVKFTVGEITDTLQSMLEKSEISSTVICEFNATKTISDPMIKSQVIAETKKRKGLK